MRRRVGMALLALAIPAMLVPVVVPAGASEPAREPLGAVTRTVRMIDDAFRPRTLRIASGTRVKWVNAGFNRHSSTGSSWDSGLLDRGDSYRRRFRREGTFPYSCSIHPSMRGTIVVT